MTETNLIFTDAKRLKPLKNCVDGSFMQCWLCHYNYCLKMSGVCIKEETVSSSRSIWRVTHMRPGHKLHDSSFFKYQPGFFVWQWDVYSCSSLIKMRSEAETRLRKGAEATVRALSDLWFFHLFKGDCSCVPRCRSTARSGSLSNSTTPTKTPLKSLSTSTTMSTTSSRPTAFQSPMRVSVLSIFSHVHIPHRLCVHAGWTELFMSNSYTHWSL